jgi:hypothetical protein
MAGTASTCRCVVAMSKLPGGRSRAAEIRRPGRSQWAVVGSKAVVRLQLPQVNCQRCREAGATRSGRSRRSRLHGSRCRPAAFLSWWRTSRLAAWRCCAGLFCGPAVECWSCGCLAPLTVHGAGCPEDVVVNRFLCYDLQVVVRREGMMLVSECSWICSCPECGRVHDAAGP